MSRPPNMSIYKPGSTETDRFANYNNANQIQLSSKPQNSMPTNVPGARKASFVGVQPADGAVDGYRPMNDMPFHRPAPSMQEQLMHQQQLHQKHQKQYQQYQLVPPSVNSTVPGLQIQNSRPQTNSGANAAIKGGNNYIPNLPYQRQFAASPELMDDQDDEDELLEGDINELDNSEQDEQVTKKRKIASMDEESMMGRHISGMASSVNGNMSASAQATEKEKKKKRQVQSCSECRRRKIKCDKKFPCGPCSTRNDQGICREVEKHTPTTTGCASTHDLLNLQHRLSVLESLLAEAGILAPGSLDTLATKPLGKSKLPHQTPLIGTSLTAAGLPKTDAPLNVPTYSSLTEPLPEADGDSDTEGAALTLESLAFGRRKIEQAGPSVISPTFEFPPPVPIPNKASSTLALDIGSRRNSMVTTNLEQLQEAVEYARKASITSLPNRLTESLTNGTSLMRYRTAGPVNSAILNALAPTEVFSIFFQRSDVFVNALLSVLPDRKRGELLVTQYLERVEWLHRCLHVPTFHVQCQDFWNTPPENMVQGISTPFLSLYLMILCLGLYFMDPQEALLSFTQEERDTLPEIWLTASRGSLWMGDFMAVHTIEHLQTITLIGIFLNNRDRADAAWSLLGAAIKMAQGMGLSRLGGEPEVKAGQELPKWKAPWESLIKREMGRRLWWNLVFLDWSLAPSYNFSSSIQPDQIKTALPANVNDEDLAEGQPLKTRPLTEQTQMSYHLARLRFAEISQRQIWQANASPHPPYSFILSVDADLRKAISELPQYFLCDFDNLEPPPQDNRSRVLYWEMIIINLSGQSRLMRLHRPWLSRGYKDRKYDYSREQCIIAARNCLKLMSDEFGTAVFLERWWMPLFYVTVAAVVVLIDLLRLEPKELDHGDGLAKRQEVVKALAQITQIADLSHPAKGAVKVITQLLVELEEKREGKPKSPIDSKDGQNGANTATGLHRAVKKLIQDANTLPPANKAFTASSGGSGTSQYGPTSPPAANMALTPEWAVQHGVPNNYGNFGSVFDFDANLPGFGAFPMEVSGGANVGMNTNPSLDFENAELEHMLASFMPSRAPSPSGRSAPDIAHRPMEFGNTASPGMWPLMDRAFDPNNAMGNPYSSWMG